MGRFFLQKICGAMHGHAKSERVNEIVQLLQPVSSIIELLLIYNTSNAHVNIIHPI